MTAFDFNQEDKARIEGEKHHNYTYYEFTEQSIRAISAKHVKDVESREWYTLVQMLYPENLICSGLFDSFLVFDIINQKRKDPPKEAYADLVTAGKKSMLLERIIATLNEGGIEPHESWKSVLAKSKGSSDPARKEAAV
jgi:hypothetical protein